jgi:hypothetical protein
MTALTRLPEGRNSFASSLDRHHPFAELGTHVDSSMNIYQALRESGSDDEVVPATLFVVDPNCSDDQGLDSSGTHVFRDKYVEVPGKMATFSDKYGPMGVNSTSYEIMQRREMLEFAYDIAGLTHNDAHVRALGNLGPHAERFFAYIEFPELTIDPNGVADKIERGLWVGTSFDGSLPNIVGYAAIRLWCLNQLNMHLKRGLSQSIRVRHTKNMDDRMHEAAVALEYVGAVEKEMIANAEKMLSIDGGTLNDPLKMLLDEFYPVDDDVSRHTRDKRMIERSHIYALYGGEGNTNVDKVGHNGWAAYNTMVEYWDHARPVRTRGNNTATIQRAEAAFLPGSIVDKKVKASNMVLALAA